MPESGANLIPDDLPDLNEIIDAALEPEDVDDDADGEVDEEGNTLIPVGPTSAMVHFREDSIELVQPDLPGDAMVPRHMLLAAYAFMMADHAADTMDNLEIVEAMQALPPKAQRGTDG